MVPAIKASWRAGYLPLEDVIFTMLVSISCDLIRVLLTFVGPFNLDAGASLISADGWKDLGIQFVGKGKWDEAKDCFKKAATFFGDAMDKENRKLMNAMAEECSFLKQTEGLGSPGQSVSLPLTTMP